MPAIIRKDRALLVKAISDMLRYRADTTVPVGESKAGRYTLPRGAHYEIKDGKGPIDLRRMHGLICRGNGEAENAIHHWPARPDEPALLTPDIHRAQIGDFSIFGHGDVEHKGPGIRMYRSKASSGGDNCTGNLMENILMAGTSIGVDFWGGDDDKQENNEHHILRNIVVQRPSQAWVRIGHNQCKHIEIDINGEGSDGWGVISWGSWFGHVTGGETTKPVFFIGSPTESYDISCNIEHAPMLAYVHGRTGASNPIRFIAPRADDIYQTACPINSIDAPELLRTRADEWDIPAGYSILCLQPGHLRVEDGMFAARGPVRRDGETDDEHAARYRKDMQSVRIGIAAFGEPHWPVAATVTGNKVLSHGNLRQNVPLLDFNPNNAHDIMARANLYCDEAGTSHLRPDLDVGHVRHAVPWPGEP